MISQDEVQKQLQKQVERELKNSGLRYNQGKIRHDLLPFDSIEEVSQVMTFGAQKYSDRGWEKGINWMICFGSLLRHTFAWWRGEDLDPESGCHHMAHVAWNALALVSYSKRKVGFDDRPKLTE